SMVSVDISEVVIRQMLQKYGPLGMTFTRMDLMKLEFPDKNFTCVLDKGTLDAVFTQDDEHTARMVDTMFTEIGRVLKVGGRYVCVSLLQGHILKKLLEWFPQQGWMVRICRCKGAENSDSGGIPFPVFIVVCTSLLLPDRKPMSVLEVSLQDERPRRLPSADAVRQAVTGLQQFAFTRHGLAAPGSGEDVRLELCDADGDEARFTLFVVDRWRKKTKKAFAIFIVPQGRETEWLFGTPAGRRQLAETAGHDRLVVVHLPDRRRRYGALQEVQEQLSGSVLQLRPAHLRDDVQVPFLTCAGDLGRRELRHRGTSAVSGDYVVEDVHLEHGDVFRRLVFLSNVNIVQSEAKLKPVAAKGGQRSLAVDAEHLSCLHHRYMDRPARLLLVGLGGGGLARFLHDKFSQAALDVVDIDPEMVAVARDWFDFAEDRRLTVHVADGLHFIRDCKTQGRQYSVIMFDVDCKDPSLGMSCPPAPFVEPDLLRDVRDCLCEDGVFVLNLVARDAALSGRVRADLSATFAACVSYPIPEEVNEVLYCLRRRPDGDLTETARAAAGAVNSKLSSTRKGKTRRDFMDMTSFARELKNL
ncbi:LOW QUALITY PROTEIN: eEF1A lysine and N-terminal methyltransferase-like, partial [Pollicipes pollicipes]|uniref:LOW QUALITY PROTEIN: eEF1A lysine and N-terminal methyltransferase-like n=1 Tax=Pollicipes pollicipes TaxID=41117 RepID=UPI0018859D8D